MITSITITIIAIVVIIVVIVILVSDLIQDRLHRVKYHVGYKWDSEATVSNCGNNKAGRSMGFQPLCFQPLGFTFELFTHLDRYMHAVFSLPLPSMSTEIILFWLPTEIIHYTKWWYWITYEKILMILITYEKILMIMNYIQRILMILITYGFMRSITITKRQTLLLCQLWWYYYSYYAPNSSPNCREPGRQMIGQPILKHYWPLHPSGSRAGHGTVVGHSIWLLAACTTWRRPRVR